MSFEKIELPRRLVGTEARYRVDAGGKKVMVVLREDTATAAGFAVGTWVEVLIGKDEHRDQFALRSVAGGGSRESRRFRKCGAAVSVDVPYLPALRKLMPEPKDPKKTGYTVSLEVVDVTAKGGTGVVILRRKVEG